MNKYVLLFSFFLASCSSCSVKDTINQAGDAAGQAAGEFIEGASKGVEKAFDVQLSASKDLTDRGIQLGKCSVRNDSNGTDNLLTIYVIFNEDFNDTLTVRAFDGELEMGRAHAAVSGKRKDAAFVDFYFDKRTNIDSKNRLTLE
jgi:hypothetical protein